MSSYSIIGLMSGTSMDGLDIAHCHFEKGINDKKWKHSVKHTKTIEYPNDLLKKIETSTRLNAAELQKLDKQLGKFYAQCVSEFIEQNRIPKQSIDAIASHGHTIFHQPESGFSLQIGCGVTLSYILQIPVINNFRQKDVTAGGQGAPLVPIGDKLLFSQQADAFLNIGGFTNICFTKSPVIAYDISPGNLPLNKLSAKVGIPYDEDGKLAASGKIIPVLLEQLNGLPYYAKEFPKSLGTEWLEKHFYPLLDESTEIPDLLHTVIEHIATQVARSLNDHSAKKLMITGGGAKNKYLIERIQAHFYGEIHLPDKQTIDFKEAIIFAFLGALHLKKEPNCLSSVTGAKKDVIGGVMHLPN